MITINNAEQALKSIYLGAVTDLLNTKVNPLLAKIEHTSVDVWGKDIRTAAKVGINGGIGAGSEDGNLPTPASNQYIQFVSTLKNLYGQIEISDKAIRASSDSRGAFTDLLNAEIEGLLNASKFNMGRMLYGDGSGLLCVGANSEAGAAVTVDDTRNLIEGMVIDIFDEFYTEICLATRIKSINRATKTIYIDKEIASTNTNMQIYVQGSMDNEITGVGAIFKERGTIYGIDRQEHPCLIPYMNKATGKIDEIKMQQVIDNLSANANSNINFISCSADAKYAYQEYMAQYKRNIDILELKGGYKTLSFNGIPVVYDRFVAPGTMYFLNTDDFKMHQLCDWRFLENEAGNILYKTPGKATYTATLVKYCDLICSKPNGQGMLSGITR